MRHPRRHSYAAASAILMAVLAACSAGQPSSPAPTADPQSGRQPDSSNNAGGGSYAFSGGYAELELDGDVEEGDLRLDLDPSVSPHWGPDDVLMQFSKGSTTLIVTGPAYTGSRVTSVGPDDLLSLTLTIDGSVFQAGGPTSPAANACSISFDPPNSTKTEAKILCQDLSDATGSRTIDMEGDFEGNP